MIRTRRGARCGDPLIRPARGGRWTARRAGAAIVLMLSAAPRLAAQGFEIAPFGGYRFGLEWFDIDVTRPGAIDRAPALGVVFDVPLSEGLQFEGLFSHQQSDVLVPQPFGPALRLRSAVDHWQGGALQEFSGGRVRPFLTGVLGLSRYAVEADSAIRFTVGGGGGVKLFPASHVGLRLDGRIFATLVDADARAVVCGGRSCVLFLHLDVAWQAEFTAGVVVKLGSTARTAVP